MAAIQLPASMTAQLNEKQKAALEKLIEKVNDEATSEDTHREGSIKTVCYIINDHKVPNTKMRLLYSKNWVGDSNPDTPVPEIVEWNDYSAAVRFDHEGQEGSVAGLVYGDGDADDTTARKWTVAFDRKNTKVYAEAGPMGPVDWDAVKFKQDHQSAAYYKHEDPVFKGVAIAYFAKLYMFAVFEN